MEGHENVSNKEEIPESPPPPPPPPSQASEKSTSKTEKKDSARKHIFDSPEEFNKKVKELAVNTFSYGFHFH